MRYLITSLVLWLTACSTVPVTMKFPETPEVLMEKCPPLKTIESEKISIIDITKSVTSNYTTYHECSVKLEHWIEWYNSQKRIYEDLKK